MHFRNIFLIASLAMPMIAMPVSTNDLLPQEHVAIERRHFSITRLYRDLFKRESIIEAVPRAVSYDTSVGEEKDNGDDEVDTLEERSRTGPIQIGPGGPSGKRGMRIGGGGPSDKRGTRIGGGGPSGKRGMRIGGGGPSDKRGTRIGGGGPSGKRSLRVGPGGPSGKRGMRIGGGGPSDKRFTESSDVQSEKVDAKV